MNKNNGLHKGEYKSNGSRTSLDTSWSNGQKETGRDIGLKILLKAVEIYLSTCRTTVAMNPDSEKIVQAGQQAIAALWHSNVIYSLYHFRKYRAAVMVSASKDGEWVARALRLWGQFPVRGSRLKGGLVAIRDMTRLLKTRGLCAGIVADGATGPPCIAQKGPLVLARDTGFPIIPTGFAARPAFYFNSWDRLVLPLPFSRAAMVYGPAIHIPARARGAELEEYRQILEKELNKATIKARMLVRSNGPG